MQDEGHVIRVLDDFRLGGGQHVCIVMEAMEHSLRRVLKTHGKGKGIHYRAVSNRQAASHPSMIVLIRLTDGPFDVRCVRC